MTFELIIFVSVALLAGAVVLFLGGRLVRHDLDRSARKNDAARPRSRTLEDLRPVQDLTVDFFANTEPCVRLLNILAGHQQPLTANALFDKARPTADHRNNGSTPPFGIEWAALWIMRIAGLVRLDERGVLLTKIGRKIHRRISTPSRQLGAGERLQRPSAYDALFVPLPVDNGASSHLHRVRKALQNYLHDSIQRNRLPASFRIGELRKPSQATGSNGPNESINSESMKRTPMKKRTIIMTAADHEELSYAIAAAGKLSARGRAELSALERELTRAEIVASEDIPTDVVTMNSRAELLDLETGERMEFTLVFPIDANIEADRISVLAPLGTAMLGYRVGDEFKWKVPYGERRLKVNAVHFQPEAAFALAA